MRVFGKRSHGGVFYEYRFVLLKDAESEMGGKGVDDGRTDKLITKTEKNELKIYTENMHVIGYLKRNQVKSLMEKPLSEYEYLYKSTKVNEVSGYRTKQKIFGKEFTVVISYNAQSQKKKKLKYEQNKKKIIEGLVELKNKAEKKNVKGKKLTKKGLCRNADKIILKDLTTIFKYKIPETGELTFEFWVDEKAEKDFKFLKDKLLIPVPPFFMRKDNRIRVHIFLCIVGMLFYRYIARKVNFIGISIKQLEHLLEGIRVAFVQNNESNKMVLVVEEMNSTQAKLFSGLGLGEFLI